MLPAEQPKHKYVHTSLQSCCMWSLNAAECCVNLYIGPSTMTALSCVGRYSRDMFGSVIRVNGAAEVIAAYALNTAADCVMFC